MNNNIFRVVGKDWHNDSVYIISDQKRFFTLEGFNNGFYTDCFEVSNQFGGELPYTNTAVFKVIYDTDNIEIGYVMYNEDNDTSK